MSKNLATDNYEVGEQNNHGYLISGIRIVGVSDSINQINRAVERIAPTDLSVIIYGENGTGKDLIAGVLHMRSQRAEKPFVKVDPFLLAWVDDNRGSGGKKEATEQQEMGQFLSTYLREARNGTIFLDRVPEVPLDGQVKLLQLLRNFEWICCEEFTRKRSGPRFVASSTVPLNSLVQKGMFRADLFHRLSEITITIPPLRERKEDVIPLTKHFLKTYAKKYRRQIPPLSRQTLDLFLEYDWPGNVRELRNKVHRLVVLGNEDQVCEELQEGLGDGLEEIESAEYEVAQRAADFLNDEETPWQGKEGCGDGWDWQYDSLRELNEQVVEKVEVETILRVLEYTHWHRKKAAQLLGVNYRTLLNKIKKYGLESNMQD